VSRTMSKPPAKALSVSMIARSIRFQHHPELTACWIWTGATSNGRAIACYGGEQESARRAVYRRYREQLPEGNLLPICQNVMCVNPSHAREAKS
jgi:hypothetical protein